MPGWLSLGEQGCPGYKQKSFPADFKEIPLLQVRRHETLFKLTDPIVLIELPT